MFLFLSLINHFPLSQPSPFQLSVFALLTHYISSRLVWAFRRLPVDPSIFLFPFVSLHSEWLCVAWPNCVKAPSLPQKNIIQDEGWDEGWKQDNIRKCFGSYPPPPLPPVRRDDLLPLLFLLSFLYLSFRKTTKCQHKSRHIFIMFWRGFSNNMLLWS